MDKSVASGGKPVEVSAVCRRGICGGESLGILVSARGGVCGVRCEGLRGKVSDRWCEVPGGLMENRGVGKQAWQCDRVRVRARRG